MNEFKIEKLLLKLNVLFDESNVKFPADLQKEIDEYWNRRKRENPSLKRGEVFTISNVENNQNEVTIMVAQTDYAHYLYTINHKIPDQYACKVIFTSCLVITNDCKLVFGKMGSFTSQPGRLQLIGGGLDHNDLNGHEFDLLSSISKEIKEEIGVDIHSPKVISFSPKYLKSGGDDGFYSLIFELKLDYSEEELRVMFREHQNQSIQKGENPEFDELYYLEADRESIKTFFQNKIKSNLLVPLLEIYSNV